MPRQEAHISYGLNEPVTTRLSIGAADRELPATAIVYLTDPHSLGPFISFWHPEQMEALAADLIAHAADLRKTQQADAARAAA